jgi:prolyl 4-hydroxylase
MREHEVNSLDKFICGYYLDDLSICDKLIDYHKQEDTKKWQGGFIRPSDNKFMVDAEIKDSSDCFLLDDLLLNEYVLGKLQPCLEEYIKKYEWCAAFDRFSVCENINIQKYSPGGGYHKWHSERGSGKEPSVKRHLVFMTYLNDISEGGYTEFYYSGIKIRPEKGLTLIWGADWTFLHRGVIAPKETKYIATGWYSFV